MLRIDDQCARSREVEFGADSFAGIVGQRGLHNCYSSDVANTAGTRGGATSRCSTNSARVDCRQEGDALLRVISLWLRRVARRNFLRLSGVRLLSDCPAPSSAPKTKKMPKLAICQFWWPNLCCYKAAVKTCFQTKCRGKAEVYMPLLASKSQNARVLARVLKFRIAYFPMFLSAFGCSC